VAPPNRYAAIRSDCVLRIACCARLRPKSHLLSCTGVFRSDLHRELPGNEVAVDMPSSFSAASNLSGACGTHVWFRTDILWVEFVVRVILSA
jgi:hypothetical protein